MATGKLSQQEYDQAVKMTFEHFDQDKDQHLNVGEFRRMYGAISGQLKFPLTDQIIEYLFNQINASKSGKISLPEMQSALKIFYYK